MAGWQLIDKMSGYRHQYEITILKDIDEFS